MNFEKINFNKGNNKFKGKSNIKYANFKNNKSICKVGNDLNLEKKYYFFYYFEHNNIIHNKLLGIKIILYYLFIFFLPIISLTKKITSELRTLNFYQEIEIKIKEGQQKIIFDDFSHFPDEILLNGNSITQNYLNNEKVLNIQGSNNIINLRWDNKLFTCARMFESLANIISIDLS